MGEKNYPPSFDITFEGERDRAIYDSYMLMQDLVDEHGGDGQIRRISDSKISIELHFELPENESE